jgi:ribosomal protein S9
VPLQNVVLQPLQTAKAVNAFDLSINTTGGGIMGQAGAAQLAYRACSSSGRWQFARHAES